MKRNKRILSAVLAALLLMLLILSGCGDKTIVDPKAAQQSAAPATEQPKGNGSGKTTPPEKGCEIAFPDGKRYHYDMALTLDAEARTVSGHVVFDFFNDSEDAWDQLCLRDYSSLFKDAESACIESGEDPHGALTEITGIRDGRDGSTLEYERDKDVSVLWIPLSEPLEPGKEMTLEYDFTATIPTVADRYGVSNGIYSVTNFYPILAEYVDGDWSHAAFYNLGECFYSEIADYDVKLTVPSGFAVLSTGTETGKTDSADGVTYTFAAPCVRDFVFAASDGFKVEDTTCDGVHINVAYQGNNPPSDRMDVVLETTFDTAEDSLAAFGDAFGKYPYDELDIILMPLDAGGMEYPNLIQISEEYCVVPESDDSEENDPDAPQPYNGMHDLQICVAHEIGHQWFMGIVGSNSGMQPWQDESLASYTELVYLEYSQPDEFEKLSWQYSRKSMDLGEERTASRLRSRDYFPLNRSFYEFTDYVYAIYGFGQVVMYQMEECVGREEFYAFLREYVQRNAFTNAEPEDFFDALYDVLGTDNEDLNALIAAAFDL